MGRVKAKKGAEAAPAAVAAFVERVAGSGVPLGEVPTRLSGFAWTFGKGDFNHWVPLFNRLDEWLEAHVQGRRDLQLDGGSASPASWSGGRERAGPGDGTGDGTGAGMGAGPPPDPEFPAEDCRRVLLASAAILERCGNKSMYGSGEHLTLLLAAPVEDVVVLALEVLATLSHRQQSKWVQGGVVGGRWHGDARMRERLFVLAQGFGGRAEGLGLVECCSAEVAGSVSDASFCFEFISSREPAGRVGEGHPRQPALAGGAPGEASRGGGGGDGGGGGNSGCSRRNLDLSTMAAAATAAGESAHSLCARLAREHGVPEKLRFALLSRIRTAQKFGALGPRRHLLQVRLLAFYSFLQCNPDLEEMQLLFSNEPDLVHELLRMLQAESTVPQQLRTLALRLLGAAGADRARLGGNVTLSSTVTGALASEEYRALVPSLLQRSVEHLLRTPGDGVAMVEDCSHLGSENSRQFFEALLAFISVYVRLGQETQAAMADAGLIGILLPLLGDKAQAHIPFLTTTLSILEGFMDQNTVAMEQFRRLDGLRFLVTRLQEEIGAVADRCADAGLALEDAERQWSLGTSPATEAEEAILPYPKVILVRGLLRVVSLVNTFSSVVTGEIVRPLAGAGAGIPPILREIFLHPHMFGGHIFALSAAMLADLLNHDPLCFAELHEAGLPRAYLDSLVRGVLPVSNVLNCIQGALIALCLNNKGRELVESSGVMGCMVSLFTSDKYLKCLAGDTAAVFGGGLDELLRHVSSLRVHAMVHVTNIFERLVEYGRIGEDLSEGTNSMAAPNLASYILNSCRLLESILHDREVGRLFIDNGGLDHLLELHTMPEWKNQSQGTAASNSIYVAFRSFNSFHSSSLSESICADLNRQMNFLKERAVMLRGRNLYLIGKVECDEYLRQVAATEGLVSLASVIVRGSTSSPMLAGLASSTSGALDQLGNIACWLLWQMSVLEEYQRYYLLLPKGSSKSANEGGGGDGQKAPPGAETPVDGPRPETAAPGSAGPGPGQGPAPSDESQEDSSSCPRFKSILDSLRALTGSINQLSVAISKAIAHARRGRSSRAEDASPNAKAAAVTLARALNVTLQYEGSVSTEDEHTCMGDIKSAASMIAASKLRHERVHVRYAEHVSEELLAALFDARRRTCGHLLLNALKVSGALESFMKLFTFVTRHLWNLYASCRDDGGPSIYSGPVAKHVQTEWKAALERTNYVMLLVLHNLSNTGLLSSPATSLNLLVASLDRDVSPQRTADEIATRINEFVKDVNSEVASVVTAMWKHDELKHLSAPNLSTLLGVMSNVFTVSNSGSEGDSSFRRKMVKTHPTVQRLMDMGFEQSVASEAIRQFGDNGAGFDATIDPTVMQTAGGGVGDAAFKVHSTAGPGDDIARGMEKLGSKVTDSFESLPCVTSVLKKSFDALSEKKYLNKEGADQIVFGVAELLYHMCPRGKEKSSGTMVHYTLAVEFIRGKLAGLMSTVDASLDGGTTDLTHRELFCITQLLLLVATDARQPNKIIASAGVLDQLLVLLQMQSVGESPGQPSSGASDDAWKCASDIKGCGELWTTWANSMPMWVSSCFLIVDSVMQASLSDREETPGGGTTPAFKEDEPRIAYKEGVVEVARLDDIVSKIPQSGTYVRDGLQADFLRACLSFLKKIDMYGGKDRVSRKPTVDSPKQDGVAMAKLPVACAQAALQLTARLTQNHDLALEFLSAGGLPLVFKMPRCVLFSGRGALVGAIVRNILEDKATLQTAMEAEIRATIPMLPRRGIRHTIHALESAISRDPAVFIKALKNICVIKKGFDPRSRRFAGWSIWLAHEHNQSAKQSDKAKALRDSDAVPKQGDEKLPSKVDIPRRTKNSEVEAPKRPGKASKAMKPAPAPSFKEVLEYLSSLVSEFSAEHAQAPSAVKEGEDKALGGRSARRGPDRDARILWTGLALKLLHDCSLMYGSTMSLLLNFDSQKKLFSHVVHNILPSPERPNAESVPSGPCEHAAFFLLAVCIRSSEGRRLIIEEMCSSLKKSGNTPHHQKMVAFVDFINQLLVRPSMPGGNKSALFSEILKNMRDSGATQALLSAVKSANLDDPSAPVVVSSILRPLEMLTRRATLAATRSSTKDGGRRKSRGGAPADAAGVPRVEAGGGDGPQAHPDRNAGPGASDRGLRGGQDRADEDHDMGNGGRDAEAEAGAGPAAQAAMQRFTTGSVDRDIVQRIGYEAGHIARATEMGQRLADSARGMLPEGASIHIEAVRDDDYFESDSDDCSDSHENSSSGDEGSDSESSGSDLIRSHSFSRSGSQSDLFSSDMEHPSSFMDGEEDEDMELGINGDDEDLEDEMELDEDEEDEEEGDLDDVEDDLLGDMGMNMDLDDGLDEDDVLLPDSMDEGEEDAETAWGSVRLWNQGGYRPDPGGAEEQTALFRDGMGGPRIEVRVRGREGWPNAMPANMVGDLLFGGFQRYIAEHASEGGPGRRSLLAGAGSGAGRPVSHPLLLRPQRLQVAGGASSRVGSEQNGRAWTSGIPIPGPARNRFLPTSEENENSHRATDYRAQGMRDGRFAPMGNLDTITPWAVRRSGSRPAPLFSGGARQQQQEHWSHPIFRAMQQNPGAGGRGYNVEDADPAQAPSAAPAGSNRDPLLDNLHRSLILELPVIREREPSPDSRQTREPVGSPPSGSQDLRYDLGSYEHPGSNNLNEWNEPGEGDPDLFNPHGMFRQDAEAQSEEPPDDTEMVPRDGQDQDPGPDRVAGPEEENRERHLPENLHQSTLAVAGHAVGAGEEAPAAPVAAQEVPAAAAERADLVAERQQITAEHRDAQAEGARPGRGQVPEIDEEFLAALPQDLRAEVLAGHAMQVSRQAAFRISAPNPGMAEGSAGQAGAGSLSAPNPAEGSVEPNARPVVNPEGGTDASDLDPEFLSALPPDLQAEVLAQQREMQRVHNVAAQQAAAPPSGTGAEMDMASILATFPAEVREEALLTLDDGTMNALPPNLLSEAIQVRQRAVGAGRSPRQGQAPESTGPPVEGGAPGGNRGRPPRGTPQAIATMIESLTGARFNNSTGRFDPVEALGGFEPPPFDGREGLLNFHGRPRVDRHRLFEAAALATGQRLPGGAVVARSLLRDAASKEPDVPAQVDSEGLLTLLRLVQLAPPLAKGILHRVMANLSLNSKVALDLVQIVSSMLKSCIDSEFASTLKLAGRLLPTPQLDLARMYGCETSIVYSKPANATSLPPLVSRRLVDLLLHLSKGENKAAFSRLIATHLFRKRVVAKSPRAGKSKRSRLDSETRELPVLQILLAFLASRVCKSSSDHLDRTLQLLLTVFKGIHEQIGKEEEAAAADEVLKDFGGPLPTKDDEEPKAKVDQEGAKVGEKAKTPDKEAAKRPGSASNRGQSSSTKRTLKADIEASVRVVPEQLLVNLVSLVGQPGHRDEIHDKAINVLTHLCLTVPSQINLVLENLCRTALSLMPSAQADLASIGDGRGLCAAPPSSMLILRVVECLHRTLDTYKRKGRGPLPAEAAAPALLSHLQMSMQPLWASLGVAIKEVESSDSTELRSAMSPANIKLVPLVEAFAVLCSCDALLPDTAASGSQPSGPSARTGEISRRSSIGLPKISSPGGGGNGTLEDSVAAATSFFSFCEENRAFVNAAIKRTPELLLGGAFRPTLAYLLQSPSLLEFENKRVYFRAKMKDLIEQKHMPSLRLLVRREYVFEDSFQYLRKKGPEEMRGKLNIQFRGEEGIDAGGVSREWYQLMARKMFNENLALFTSSEGGSTFQPNPNSGVQSEDIGHLDYFRFTGRVVGKALMDGQLMDAYFTRSFYKHMLREPLTVEDIEAVDPDYYKNLKWMLENDITGVLDLSFTAETDYFGKKEMVELKPGGAQCAVTEENKADYVKRVCEHRMTTAIKPQIEAFLQGFWELVPRDLISMFNNAELELLISGLPDIDKGELRAHTDYTGYVPASPIVQWFWEVVDELNKEDMARLLQFCTGTSKVPLDGFKALQGISGPQKFQIHRAYGPLDRLPAAHTCFNQLDLIEYESKDQLREKLLLAIHEGSEGFGFG